MLTDLTIGRQFHRANALAYYESVLADRTASHRDKTKAQERIDKLLGLEDKSNQPPLEVFLGQLPAVVSEPLRRVLAERVRFNGSGASPPTDGGLDGLPGYATGFDGRSEGGMGAA